MNVIERLKFYFKTKIGNEGNTNWLFLSEYDEFRESRIRTEHNKFIPDRNLTIDDINIQVRFQVDDTIEEDRNCDGDFMV